MKCLHSDRNQIEALVGSTSATTICMSRTTRRASLGNVVPALDYSAVVCAKFQRTDLMGPMLHEYDLPVVYQN